MELYLVGGAVRDSILGVNSNDIDYSVVLDPGDPYFQITNDPFRVMRRHLIDQGFNIFLETPDHFTVRAQFPKGGNGAWNGVSFDERGVGYRSLTADFVLARKEGPYSDGRRPDWVKPGELSDDIFRRDFTINALAKDSRGNIIDLVNGVQDIQDRIIRTVGDPAERLLEDALRAVRALRFSITKGFRIEGELMKVLLWNNEIHDAVREDIADERISEEVSKMFRFDTVRSMMLLHQYPALTQAMFAGRLSLDATLKTKGRGK